MKKNIVILFLYSIPLFAQWSEQNSGIYFSIFSLSAVNDSIVWASTSFNNVLRTTNGGLNWENVGANIPEPNGFQPCIFALDANTALFSCYDGSPVIYSYVYKTTNAGANWTLVFTQGDDSYISGIWIKNNNEGIMVGWPVGGRWSLWKTSNAGNSWDSSGLFIPETDPSVWSYENSLVYLNNRIWFGARNRGIYYSSDNGASWTLQDVTWSGYAYPSAIWFENTTHGFSSADKNIIRTETSGMNWTITPNSSGSEIIKGITGSGNNWWYVRFLSNKIFSSTDDGDTWYPQYTAPTNSGYNHITRGRNGTNRMWAARIDGGISVYSGPLAVNKVTENSPVEFKLYKNYPNPFNPITKIKFDIGTPLPLPNAGSATFDKGGIVTLKIFDVMGREITTLVNEQLNPGTYEVEWNADNFPSGVYFYKLHTENFSETKRMVLIK